MIVVVDQMRFDYLDRYARFWKHGLKRLRDEGAIFEQGVLSVPEHRHVRRARHDWHRQRSPSTHGIIMNEWWQRARRSGACRAPTIHSVMSLAYGGTAGSHRPQRAPLRVPTLGDRLRAASPASRVVTLSMKPRSTVMLAGHGGTAVTWFGDSNAWATSIGLRRRAGA